MVKKKIQRPTQGKKIVKKKKGGAKGCLFWIVLLAIIGGGGFYAFGPQLMEKYGEDLSLPADLSLDKLSLDFGKGDKGKMKKETVEMPKVVAEPKVTVVAPKRDDKADFTPKKIQPQKGERLYYIRVGSCMSTECRERLLRGIKQINLPVFAQKRNKETIYHELISSAVFSQVQVKARLAEIERYNKMGVPAFSVRQQNGQYRISFGRFPDFDRAQSMKSYLAQLYPNVNVPFKIVPQKNHFNMEVIYAGPFDSYFNAQNVADVVRDVKNVQETTITTTY